ncbi:MAG: nucleotidyltransferase domain-containing protein [Acidimicrobiales bacterium]
MGSESLRCSEGKLRQAQTAARVLASDKRVEAVVVFGSVARGTAKPSSDIDLLVVSVPSQLEPSVIRRRLATLDTVSIAIASRSYQQFADLMISGDSFACHLSAEALILHDRSGAITAALAASPTADLAREIAMHLRRLSSLERVEQFGGYFVFLYSRVYGIAKSIVMARLCASGTPVYDRDRAFATLARQHPELRDHLAVIHDLAPFYEATTRRSTAHLSDPYEGPGGESRAARALDAVRAIADV